MKRILKLKRLTNITQVDKILPRGSSRSLRTLSPFLVHSAPFNSSSSFPSLSHSHTLFTTKTIFSSSLDTINISACSMESYSTDSEALIKDQEREACCKGACDYNASRGSSTDDILRHIINLYASCATSQDFEIYAPHATFEDPLMCAHGIKQIKSAFYSLAKVFSESRIVDYSVKENVISPGKKEILIDNKQYYKFMGRDVNMISLIKLYVEQGKVVRHEDWWDKKPLWNRETIKTPLLGRVTEMTRRASMLATHAIMGFGKDPDM